MKKKHKKYSFMIFNTDRSDKDETHCWSILDLHPKKEIFLFGSFGLKGLKNFIIKDDKIMINKVLYGLEKFKKVDNKLTIVEKTFSRTEYKKIAKKGIRKLITRARGLLHFANEF